MAGRSVRIRLSPEGFCRMNKRSKDDSARDRRLIEEWLPIAELSPDPAFRYRKAPPKPLHFKEFGPGTT